MSSLTHDQVRHIAKLARLRLTDAEAEKYAKELSSILSYVDMLQEVDTSSVEPTAQVTGQVNSMREDDIRTDGASPDALLGCSPLRITDHQIVTPSAHSSTGSPQAPSA